MPNVRKAIDIESEVAHGLAKELGILRRWLDAVGTKMGAGEVHRLDEYNDFDYLVLKQESGFPLCYLEIKSRRAKIDTYGDCIMPLRKHERALSVWDLHKIESFCVTEYSDGNLVAVLMRMEPASTKNIRRKDRPGTPAVPHAIYSKSQMGLIA
jgi:hypothetical protein